MRVRSEEEGPVGVGVEVRHVPWEQGVRVGVREEVRRHRQVPGLVLAQVRREERLEPGREGWEEEEEGLGSRRSSEDFFC